MSFLFYTDRARFMKIVRKIHLLATQEDKQASKVVMDAFNAACNYAARLCYTLKLKSRFALHKPAYAEIRKRFGLTAKLTNDAIARACVAYSGNTAVCPWFSGNASLPLFHKTLKVKITDTVCTATITLPALDGIAEAPNGNDKVKRYSKSCEPPKGMVKRKHNPKRVISFKKSAYVCVDKLPNKIQHALLVYKDNNLYLHITCDIEEPNPYTPTNVLGIDLGVKNIATDSTGEIISGDVVELTRQKIYNLCTSLVKKGTKSSKRKLKKIGRRESRYRAYVNHCISKRLVVKAKGTNSLISLEDLTGINKAVTVRKEQRARRLSWSFYQLRMFITYKAQQAGVPVVLIDPKYTSQTCSVCGHCDKANRKTQELFDCTKCKHTEHADINAAKNIAAKGIRAVANQPIVVRSN